MKLCTEHLDKTQCPNMMLDAIFFFYVDARCRLYDETNQIKRVIL